MYFPFNVQDWTLDSTMLEFILTSFCMRRISNLDNLKYTSVYTSIMLVMDFFFTNYTVDPYMVFTRGVYWYISFLLSCQPTMEIPNGSFQMEINYDDNYLFSITGTSPDFQIVVNLMKKPSSTTFNDNYDFKIMHIPVPIPSNRTNMMISRMMRWYIYRIHNQYQTNKNENESNNFNDNATNKKGHNFNTGYNLKS